MALVNLHERMYKEVMSVTFGNPKCNECGCILTDEPPRTPVEERNPCPTCGSVGRIQDVRVYDRDNLAAEDGSQG